MYASVAHIASILTPMTVVAEVSCSTWYIARAVARVKETFVGGRVTSAITLELAHISVGESSVGVLSTCHVRGLQTRGLWFLWTRVFDMAVCVIVSFFDANSAVPPALLLLWFVGRFSAFELCASGYHTGVGRHVAGTIFLEKECQNHGRREDASQIYLGRPRLEFW